MLLLRLRAELAAIAKQTMPDQNGFKVASDKLLARISKFNNLEDTSAQVRHVWEHMRVGREYEERGTQEGRTEAGAGRRSRMTAGQHTLQAGST
jgi:hypothetical protein